MVCVMSLVGLSGLDEDECSKYDCGDGIASLGGTCAIGGLSCFYTCCDGKSASLTSSPLTRPVAPVVSADNLENASDGWVSRDSGFVREKNISGLFLPSRKDENEVHVVLLFDSVAVLFGLVIL